jgi:hypothetical protein
VGFTHWVLGLAIVPTVLVAQAAPTKPLTEAQQIAASVLPLPAEFRANARILGYRGGSAQLVPLREGRGPFTCLATPPSGNFHLACYHNAMEPFMARGRELREQGVRDAQVDTVRFAEVKAGKLTVPSQPAAMYQLFGGTYDAEANTVTGARQLFVAYIPNATAASTGLSDKPAPAGTPWIMGAGTPKAHIMLTPKM